MFVRRSIGALPGSATSATAALAASLALTVTIAAGGCRGAGAAPAVELAVRRGDFQQRVLLTGEIESGRSTVLKVPPSRVSRLEIRTLIKDGTPVAAGQVVAELDNSEFTAELEDKRLANLEKDREIARQTAAAEADDAERGFRVEQRQADRDKARLQAAVPQGLLPEREYEDRQLALRHAELELAHAEADQEAHRKASADDLAVKRIEIARGAREIAEATDAITHLVLRAPTGGIALIAEDAWEGRKLRAGDALFTDEQVVLIPDLSTLQVRAALSDVDDGRVLAGMPARLTLDAYPDRSYAGRVVEVSPVARETARSSLLRSFKVTVDLLEQDPARMRPGMSVKVEVLGAPRAGVLLAPRAALDLAARPPVALLAGGGTVAVRLGACDPLTCVVESGLTAGELLRPRAAEPPETAASSGSAGSAG